MWRTRPAAAALMIGAPTVVMPVIAPAGPVPMPTAVRPTLLPGREAVNG
jgi:hypothetical protein